MLELQTRIQNPCNLRLFNDHNIFFLLTVETDLWSIGINLLIDSVLYIEGL